VRELAQGFTHDYVSRNGRFLEITKEAGLKIDDLDKLQLKMIQSNQIPSVLPLLIEERDFNINLYYKVENYKTFRNFARGKRISPDEFYQFLLAIIKVLEDSKIYMLNKENYVLNEDFIYVGNNLNDIYLTYLPLGNVSATMSLSDVLRELFTDVSDIVEDLRTADLQKLRSYFKEHRDNFDLSGLKARLLEVMEMDTAVTDNQGLKYRELEQIHHAREQISSTAEPLNQNVYPLPNISHQPKSQIQKEITAKAIPKELPPMNEREKVIILGVAVLAVAFMWKIYLDAASEGLLYISLGVTLLIITVVIILAKVWRPGVKSEIEYTETIAPNLDDYHHPTPPFTHKTFKQEVSSNHQDEIVKFSAVPDYTQMLNEDGATEFLGTNDRGGNSALRPYLQVQRETGLERLDINANIFTIGRNASVVDYCANDTGISRVHTEITRNNDTWAIRDLESKNGTFINDQKLIPNKYYKIESGDKIRLATLEFTFHLEN
jgi:cell division protein FtsL